MSESSNIEWTDATWNPITGCALVSEGCRHCYAARLAGTRLKHHPSRKGLARQNSAGEWKFTGEVRFNEQWLQQPMQWQRPRMVFVCAHGDLFAEGVPDDWIDKVFVIMALSPQHTFQVLTKRPDRMRDYLLKRISGGDPYAQSADAVADILDLDCCPWVPEPDHHFPLPNVWLGVSAEDQARADERIPLLLDTPAAKRFISAEPLLGPVRLPGFYPVGEDDGDGAIIETSALDWVIVGGESGPGTRDWPGFTEAARALRDQCTTAGVAFFMKQMPRKAPIPDDLLVRQFPEEQP